MSANAALYAAVSALYFDDGSDFKRSLHMVVHELDPELARMLRSNPKAAFDQAFASRNYQAPSDARAAFDQCIRKCEQHLAREKHAGYRATVEGLRDSFKSMRSKL